MALKVSRWVRFCVAAAVVFASVCAAPVPAQAETVRAGAVRRFALVIGNNAPLDVARGTLRYADDDAAATHRLLLEAGVDSVLLTRLDADTQRIVDVAPWGAPTQTTVAAVFRDVSAKIRAANAVGARTELLLFYSGHGDVEQGEGFVVLEDGRLTRGALFDFLTESAAGRNHVFIDACKSYFLVFDRGPGGERTTFTGSLVPPRIPANLDNTGFVLSTSSNRDSHEWERYQGGILSHQLRSALRGASDVNRDGRIDYAELGAFLTVANQHIENSRFRPDFMVRPPKADLHESVLTWNRPHSLSFGKNDWGHFYVEGRRGERLLDAHPHPDQTLRLWLPAERPLFVRKDNDSSEYVVAFAAPTDVETLAPTRNEIASRGAINLALEELFRDPFSERDVAAYTRVTRAARAPLTLDQPQSTTPTFRHLVGGAAIGAGVASLALCGVAFGTYLSSANATQLDTARSNRRVEATYRTAGVFAVSAAALGVGWAVLKWSEDDEEVIVSPSVGAGFAGATLSGAF